MIAHIGGMGVLRRIVRPVAFLTLLLALVAWSELSAALATEFLSAHEAELARLVNAERAAHGLPTLGHSDALRTVARRQSQRMMIEGTIFHNQRLAQDIEVVFPDWARIGENVGVGPSIPSVHQAFMDSPGHRANVLDPDYAWLGVGVVAGGTRLFMTENFLTLMDGAPRPLPAQFRLAGADRHETAGAIAEFGFTSGAAPGAVLAPSDDFRAALAGAALAGSVGGPTLLTPTDRLADATRAALEHALGGDRSGKTVFLVGGPFARSVHDALAGLGVRVVALSGAGHAETAAAIARALPRRPEAAFIATVRDYPDALAVSALAAVKGWPVLYTAHDRLPDATRDALRALGVQRTYLVGGSNAVSDVVAGHLAAAGAPVVQRLAGVSRIETATAVADFAMSQGMDARHPQVATAYNHPDALAGGALAGVLRSPVLLTAGDHLHPALEAWLRAHKDQVDGVYVLGGTAAVSTAVETALADALR